MIHGTRLVLVTLIAVIGGACAGAGKHTTAMSAAVSAEPLRELDHSVFARDPAGQLSEAALQEILSSPLTLELPARVGILPIVEAEDWRGPGPDHAIAPDAASTLARALKSENFSLVTEMMPIPSGALGMEALREIAARYKLRYLVLYRENIHHTRRVNPWAVGYITLIGAAFLPGSTLRIDGHVEASLFDVKTGLLLFTVRERVAGEQDSNLWHREDKLVEMQEKAALKVADRLALAVRKSVFQFAQATLIETERLAAASRPQDTLPQARFDKYSATDGAPDTTDEAP